MNTLFFGPLCWDFLHKLPWLQSKEILSYQDTVYAIRFSYQIIRILPCKYCRNSGENFEKQLGLLSSLLHFLPSSENSELIIMTRSKWAQYWCNFHNLVNKKLNKTIKYKNWIDTLKEKRNQNWITELWFFLYILCWNYPENNPNNDIIYKYENFFYLLPLVLKYSLLGKEMKKAIKKYPLNKQIVSSRNSLCLWIYDIRSQCNESSGKELKSLHEIHRLVELYRARSIQCSSLTNDNDILKVDNNVKSCQ